MMDSDPAFSRLMVDAGISPSGCTGFVEVRSSALHSEYSARSFGAVVYAVVGIKSGWNIIVPFFGYTSEQVEGIVKRFIGRA